MVAARRSHRLHQADCRRVPDRRHARRRFGRAHPFNRLPAGGADLGAQRPGADVLPRFGRRPETRFSRSHRPQRTVDPDREFRVGPGLVAAARVRGIGEIREMKNLREEENGIPQFFNSLFPRLGRVSAAFPPTVRAHCCPSGGHLWWDFWQNGCGRQPKPNFNRVS
ncbi:hypothetical protein MES4922_100055 [Mesorhizobium ventifaucium]|uniref:Uncharacterized protein n=1 Tax=Mesorhizobium ventifaucium TaxID=666020 RepID=A0ABN8JBL0_9HYPH|nr:hypothetical protein MES4922_100055 [Mesorhizobium ventifaucium]